MFHHIGKCHKLKRLCHVEAQFFSYKSTYNDVEKRTFVATKIRAVTLRFNRFQINQYDMTLTQVIRINTTVIGKASKFNRLPQRVSLWREN